MKVKELIEILSGKDPDLEVIYELYSDYSDLHEDDITYVQLVDKGYYKERYYIRQYPDDAKPELTTYLCFPGN